MKASCKGTTFSAYICFIFKKFEAIKNRIRGALLWHNDLFSGISLITRTHTTGREEKGRKEREERKEKRREEIKPIPVRHNH